MYYTVFNFWILGSIVAFFILKHIFEIEDGLEALATMVVSLVWPMILVIFIAALLLIFSKRILKVKR